MNQEQKRFTIEKIEKYEELQETEKKNLKKGAIYAGIMAFGTLCNVVGMTSETLFPHWVSAIAGIGTVIGVASGLKTMISAIGRKAGISNMLETLHYQMDVAELGNEESRGPRL